MRTRLRALLAAAAVTVLLLSWQTAGQVPNARAAGDLPLFTSTGAIIDRTDPTLPHNPTKEFIYPAVFHAGAALADPLGEWYLYYAPHDAPGGIALMYADSLDGPWTQYADSPVISNVWPGVYAVSHVSGPDAYWKASENKLYMFFHGENTTQRWATSTDGVTFTYGGTAVDTAMVEAAQPGKDATETSYGRVFANPDTSSSHKYAMFIMTNYADDRRRINVATSPDLRAWTVRPSPLLGAAPEEGNNVSGADLLNWNGQRYIVYGSSSGNISARTVNAQLTATGPAEKLYVSTRIPPESGRAAAPQIVTANGATHLFYEVGTRSATTIAHAVLDPDGVRDPFNTNPSDPNYATCPGPGSDEFGGASLDPAWNHGVRGSLDRSTVSGGALRIPTYVGNSTSAPLILRGLRPTPWEVSTRLVLDPAQNFQQAGLIARVSDANSARLSFSHVDGAKRIDFVWRENGVDRNEKPGLSLGDNIVVPSSTTQVWLRMNNDGTYITASYSLDGVTFLPIGRYIPRAKLSPVDIGPFAYRGSASTPELVARFDWFRYTPASC